MESNLKIITIIQARMNSKRLPGKVLLPILGKTVLQHIIERLNYCKTNSKITQTICRQQSIINQKIL